MAVNDNDFPVRVKLRVKRSNATQSQHQAEQAVLKALTEDGVLLEDAYVVGVA